MSDKTQRKKAGRHRRGRAREKKSGAKINFGGLRIEMPPELDLPAGAPLAPGALEERTTSIPADFQALLKPLASIATNAWRARARMVDTETGEPLEEMRRVHRFVEGMFAALADAGVRVVDPTGKKYDSGMALKVLSFEPTPGLRAEEVIETIRPSIAWQEQLLQMGEVIVGVPDTQETKDAGSAGTASDDTQRPVSDVSDPSDTQTEGESREQDND